MSLRARSRDLAMGIGLGSEKYQISDSVDDLAKTLMSTFTLSEAAEKRKERLLALKKRKRGQTDDLDQENERNSPPQNDPSSPQPEGKPYSSPIFEDANLPIASLSQAETTTPVPEQPN